MVLVSQKLIDIYQEKITQIIDELGKNVVLVLPEKEEDCPNCLYDGVNKRSKNIYDSTNTNALNSGLNIPFVTGQICPVCSGRGKLKYSNNKKTIICSVAWNPKEYEMVDGLPVKLPANVCKCKTKAEYYNDIVSAIEFWVSGEIITSTNTRQIKCKMYKPLTPRGLGEQIFTQFYLKMEP
jgi:uncharacterized protein YbaR (Trm112 family)